MKKFSNHHHGKSGGVLLAVLIVMLLFFLLTAGLYKLREMGAVEGVHFENSKEAFWRAEAGLLDAVQRLRYNDVLRNAAKSSSTSFGNSNGLYRVTVTDNGTGNTLAGLYSFDVVSVGYSGQMNRRIRQVVNTYPGPGGPIIASGTIVVNQNTTVGPGPTILLPGAELIINDKIPPGNNEETDFDIVIVSPGASINEKKSGATEGEHYATIDLPVETTLPPMPDYSGYEAYAMSTNSDVTINLDPAGMNLGDINPGGEGSVIYYNVPGGITINTITGGGTIVNTGPITISPKSNVGDVDVAGNVEIVSFASVDIGQKNDFLGDTTVYAEEWIYFGDHSKAASSSSFFADGKDGSNVAITMGGHSQFEGFIYADEGDINVQQGSGGDETRIEGALASGGNVDIGQNSNVVYNPDFTGGYTGGDITVGISNWKELPPL